MSAQEQWKECYRKFIKSHSVRNRKVMKSNMRRFTREAAFERKLEAAERRINELETALNQSEESREFAARLEFGG